MNLVALEIDLFQWVGKATFEDGITIDIEGFRECEKYFNEVRKITAT
jgi:hypothetical protein